MAAGSLSIILLSVFALVVARFLYKGFRIRRQLHALPGPPHSYLLGHLSLVAQVAASQPFNVHHQVLMFLIAQQHGFDDFFYLDTWPFSDPLLVVVDPSYAQHLTNLPKSPLITHMLDGLVGKNSLVAMNGLLWKTWRTMLNPGFSLTNLMTLVPEIVDRSIDFCDVLQEHARAGDLFRMEEIATRLTIDIIGKIVLDVNLDSQHGDNELLAAFRSQVWLCGDDQSRGLFDRYNPWTMRKIRENTAMMNSFIGKIVDDRLASRSAVAASGKPSPDEEVKLKYIIDIILDAGLGEQQNKEKAAASAVPPARDERPSKQQQQLPQGFRDTALTQIKTFMFAGHDTTSSTICYAYHLLHNNPRCLAALRAEHDQVLGDVDGTADAIRSNPQLLSRLEYTTAVVKETLRLYNPAGTLRVGTRDAFVHSRSSGHSFPTAGFNVYFNNFASHRRPALWGATSHAFVPERFLSSPTSPATTSSAPQPQPPPNKNAWRPFEKGPRRCIGQDLAVLETKIILALTVRRFDVATTFRGTDRLEGAGTQWARERPWDKRPVLGDEAYQVRIGIAKPRQGMPARVSMVERNGGGRECVRG
ncbi:cytochrome P450 [Phyllosticta citrichinensis]|uniref:Cytochrome P450 n=1 Tax=Phyllosticta citrichinensis TaxID=1130410 RepID=A0ABR1Y2D0_9PEZI